MCNFLNILHKLHREKTNKKNSVACIHWFNFCGVTIKKADACKAPETHEVSYPIFSCHFVFPDLISMTNDFISTQNYSSVALNWIASVSVCNTGARPSITSKESLGMKGARGRQSQQLHSSPDLLWQSWTFIPTLGKKSHQFPLSWELWCYFSICLFYLSISTFIPGSSPWFLVKVEG